jgi:photosystem II stability/assembly factor-like uncharacterized protein
MEKKQQKHLEAQRKELLKMNRQKSFLLGLIAFAIFLATNPLFAGGKWNILQSQDPEDIRDYNAIAFVTPNEGWVVGISALEMESPGYIGHTLDGGKKWEKVEIKVDKQLSNLCFADAKNGWAVGEGGMIVGTNDGGKSWRMQTSKVDNWLYGVHFINANVGYAVGMSETVVQTTTGGKTWKVIRGGKVGAGVGDEDTVVFNSVHFLDESTGWVAGVKLSPSTGSQSGIIQKTTDEGKTWTDQPTHVEDILKAIAFVDASHGWAVGENGVILHTANGGETWNIQTSHTEENLLSVRFVDRNVGWAVGGALGVNVIMHTADGGQTWENQRLTDTTVDKLPVNHLFILDANHIWVTGNNGVVLSYFIRD